jgi:hypothetical protein
MTDHQTLPVDLDYEDPHPISLNLAAIECDGARIRVRRRIAGTAAAAALGLGVAAGVAVLRPSAASPSPSTGTDLRPISQFFVQNPPLSEPVVIDTWPVHWTTVGWVTADGQFCYAVFRTPAAGTFPQSHCEGIDGDLNADGKADASVGMPLPAMAPMEDRQTFNRPGKAPALHPFVGVVRGNVARIAVTAYGQVFTADATPLTTRNGVEIGIFQIWLAPSGGSWDSTDIQAVVAYDSHGTIVTRQGPWIPPTKPTS